MATDNPILHALVSLSAAVGAERQRTAATWPEELQRAYDEANDVIRANVSPGGDTHPEAAPRWRYVDSDRLPDGTPVDHGTTLYTFEYGRDGHWEYDLPALPGPQIQPEGDKRA